VNAAARPPRRRYVALTDGFLADRHHAKTAHGVLRYSQDEVVAIVDPAYAGMRLSDVVPGLGRDAPIVAGIREALAFSPTSLLIGIAISGGRMPEQFRRHVLAAIDAGLEIVNGLHEFLSDDEEFVAHARASGARLWDVRRVPPDIPLFSGAAYRVPQVVVLAVGSDCSVGKMTVMLELARAARAAGDSAEFVATGQTGIMIAGRGIAVDRVISDFIAGACEQLVLSVDPAARFTLVEGQGSILHPAFAPVTYGLLFGSAPDLLVLCHEVGRDRIDGYDVPIPDLRTLARLYEAAIEPVKPAPCIAVALNTAAVGEDQARAAIRRARELTGLPTDDPLRFGGADLWQAVRTAARRTAKYKEHKEAAPAP
jgi:uncharacterized NAD-dependent epimerase/dehydratase family protein